MHIACRKTAADSYNVDENGNGNLPKKGKKDKGYIELY